jgi:hypothetical protein
MELMGKANWWAPGWLVRYLPTIRVEGSRDATRRRGFVGSGSEAS